MYNIREITSADKNLLNECLQLMWDTQGINVCTFDNLSYASTSSDSLLLMVFENQKLVGGAVAKVLNSDFEYYAPFDPKVVELLQKARVGSLSMMGIHPEHQGKGLGQKLSLKRMEWLNRQGCDLLVGISWVSGLAHTSNRVFEKMGFKAVNTIPNFFAESSIAMNLICPVCGDPPCLCAATMYLKDCCAAR